MKADAEGEESTKGKKSAESSKAEDEPSPALGSALKVATDQLARFQDVADTIRTRSETTAKVIAGLGTTAIGALGITKFADVFPVENQPGWGWLLVSGFALMALSVGIISLFFWNVNRPVFTTSSIATMSDLSKEEMLDVQRVYEDTARLNAAPSLQAYEARAYRRERIADKSPPDSSEAKRLVEQAGVIRAEVKAAQARAAAIVVRRRARNAVVSRVSIVLVVLFAVGFGVAGVTSDALDSERNATARAKVCAETLEVVKKQSELVPARLLSVDCGLLEDTTGEQMDPTPTPTPSDVATVRADYLASLSAQYRECVIAGRSTEACNIFVVAINGASNN